MGSCSRSMLTRCAASDAASLSGGRCRPRGAAAARLPTEPAPPSPHRPSCRKTALINTVVIGAVNVGCTIIAVLAVDRFGRRFLLVEGGIQCCIMMIIVGERCCAIMNTVVWAKEKKADCWLPHHNDQCG